MLLGEVLKNINKKHKKIRFSNIKFDSRDCKPNDLFFAISGNNSDGNRYIKNAIKNGARIIVSNSKLKKVPLFTDGSPYCDTIKNHLDQEGISYIEKTQKKPIKLPY